jgi:hypothetical protein
VQVTYDGQAEGQHYETLYQQNQGYWLFGGRVSVQPAGDRVEYYIPYKRGCAYHAPEG